MKKYNNLFVFFALLCCLACSNQDEVLETPLTVKTVEKQSHLVSKKEAINYALQFAKEAGIKTRTGEEPIVESIHPWLSSEIFTETRSGGGLTAGLPDTMLYIVNFQHGGYSLVSADDRVPGVMAYIPQGQRASNAPVTNPGMQFFLNGLKNYYRAAIIDTTIVRRETEDLDVREIIINDTTQIFSQYTNPYVINSRVDPILTTCWGQGDPYNRLCFTENGEQAVAGCVAIAVDQVLAHHRYPSSYDGYVFHWNDIMSSSRPLSETACNDVAKLVYETGKLVKMQYGIYNSNSYAHNIDSCLTAMGYDFDHQSCLFIDEEIDSGLACNSNYDFNRLMDNFQNNKPVIITALGYELVYGFRYSFGHAWVLDGGLSVANIRRILDINNNRITCETDKQNFVHCNWGWNGTDDGYYTSNAFTKVYDEQLQQVLQSTFNFSLFVNVFYDTQPNNNN